MNNAPCRRQPKLYSYSRYQADELFGGYCLLGVES